ncbi:MAG: HAD family hydrolase [Bacteroidales bacterium]
MKKEALLLDLDNTIFPVSSIGDELFAPLFRLILGTGEYQGDFEVMKKHIMSKPFQWVARKYHFSDSLKYNSFQLLENLTYNKPIQPFEDYSEIKKLALQKFLITAGFTRMQQSKIQNLGIQKDFSEIFIIDSMKTARTKKDFFKDIAEKYHFQAEQVLVVGDDYDSEIKFAKELGMGAILYDKAGLNKDLDLPEKIMDFRDLRKYI